MFDLAKSGLWVPGDHNIASNIIPRLGNRLFLYNYGTELLPWVSCRYSGRGSASRQSDHLYAYASSSSRSLVTWQTDVPVDVSPYKKACVLWYNDGSNSDYQQSYFTIRKSKITDGTQYPNSGASAYLVIAKSFSIRLTVLDISACGGMHYVSVTARIGGQDSTVTTRLRTYLVYLER